MLTFCTIFNTIDFSNTEIDPLHVSWNKIAYRFAYRDILRLHFLLFIAECPIYEYHRTLHRYITVFYSNDTQFRLKDIYYVSHLEFTREI